MDHLTIDAGNVVELYVTRRLPPELTASFEEHYLDCRLCCERIEAAERLQRGLRRLAEEAAAGVPLSVRGAAPAARAPRLALAAAALLAIGLLPAGLELRQLRQLRGDLTATQSALARESGRAATRIDAGRLAAVTATLTTAQRDLAAATAQREALARDVAAARRPPANLPLLALTPSRGGAAGAPPRTLALPRQPGWVALWVEPGGEDYPAYRVTLREAAHDGAAFQASGLTLNPLGALLVLVPSSSLAPGAYRVEVDGLPAGGGAAVAAGRFPVRVAAAG